MRSEFYSPLLFLLLFHVSLHAQERTVKINVREQTTQVPLEGIEVTLDYEKGKVKSVTQHDGTAYMRIPAKTKYLSIYAEDSSKTHHPEYRYFDKKEIQTLREVEFTLRKRQKIEVSYAQFRAIDAQIDEKLLSSHADTTVYVEEDQRCPAFISAEFTGGPAAMQIFISENINYPQDAIEFNEQGKIYLRAIIEADGTLGHVTVQKGTNSLLDYESVRLLYAMPSFVPASCNGKAVRSEYVLPIHFTLN
jgi:hypothetical protein